MASYLTLLIQDLKELKNLDWGCHTKVRKYIIDLFITYIIEAAHDRSGIDQSDKICVCAARAH